MEKDDSYKRAKQLLKENRPKEAASIYESLANAGDTQCQIFLGWMYYQGLGVDKSNEKAFGWFERAASLGSKEGIYHCGRYWFQLKDYRSALEWLRKPSVQDYGPALLLLGIMHAKGLGVGVDINSGIKYLERSAETGNHLAERELAVLMIRGKLGISRIPLGLLLFPYAVIRAIVSGIAGLI